MDFCAKDLNKIRRARNYSVLDEITKQFTDKKSKPKDK